MSRTSRSAASCEKREYLDRFYATKYAYDYLFCLVNNIRRTLSNTFGGPVGVPGNFVDVSSDFMDVPGILVRALLKRGLSTSGC